MADESAQVPPSEVAEPYSEPPASEQAPPAVEGDAADAANGEAAPPAVEAVPDAATVNAQVAAAAAEARARAAALVAQFAQQQGDDSGANKRKLDSDAYGDDPQAKRHGGSEGISTMTFLPTGEACDVVNVPADKIGRLIGRAGATIKVIQERGMTRLKVDHNATGPTKPVTVTGTPENVALTRRLIMEAVEDSGPGGGGGGGGSAGLSSHSSLGGGAHGGHTAGADGSRKFTCQPSAVGRIIGRGGETIRSVQNASGAHINVNQNFPEGQPREVEITGRPDQVEAAYRMIMDLIGTDGAPNAQNVIQKHGQGATREVTCPKNMVGRVIGKGGETVKNLQKQYAVSIQVDQSVTPCRVTITGPPSSIEAAERAVRDLVEDRGPAGFGGGRPGGPGGYSGAPGGYGANPYPGAPPPAPYGGYGGPPPPAYGGAGGGYGAAPYGGAPPAHGGYGAPPSGHGGGYGAPAPSSQPSQAPAYGGGAGGYGGAGGGSGGYPAAGGEPYAQGGAQGGYGAPGAAGGGYGAPAHQAAPAGGYAAPGQAGGYGGHQQGGQQGYGGHQGGGYQQSAAPPPQAPPPRPPSAWSEQKDDQGRVYFYNSQTGVSQWERPHDM